MSRLRFSEIPNTAVLTPPAGKATVFLDSADNVLKAKLDDGSLIILSVTQEYLDDLVSNLLQDSVTIDFTYDDVGNKITGEVIQSALNISLIPNTPSGNLTATDVQSALNELQSDVDTRALQSDLTAHENLTSGVHGVTGSIVGTTDTQTLTNKTIDADNNTILDLEVDNLKSGVLNTSITLAGASDTQIPSALAVKTYVDNAAAAQNEASEISYDNVTSGLTATNVQDAIDEVETGLANHVSDTVDAHNASAISVIPSGNLSSTEVQSALVELQSDIDNIGASSAEVAQDAVGSILLDSTEIDFTYDDITPSITADLKNTTVVAGTYGTSTQVPTVVVDAKGRLTSASNTTIAIPSTQITDFTEAVQDVVGTVLVDSGSVDFTYNDAGNAVSATVLPAGVNHDLLQNYVTNQHVDHSTVSINPGTGLSGGGDITASRTLNIANTTVTPGSYGSATQVSTVTVNAQGQLTSASNTSIAIPSTQVTDFTEATQDAVGNILTDSSTVDLTYNDVTNTISAVVVDGSITDVKVATGINATKIGTGTVDNTEFGYLNGVTSDIQTQLNNKQPLDSTLTALAAYNANGLVTQTAADTFVGRTVIGTASNISVVNGDGIAGNPTLDLINAGTAGTYGSASQVPVLTTDAKGRVISVTNTPINPNTTATASTGNQTTNSTAYVLLTGMTLTPEAGTYQVIGTTTFTQNTNNAQVRTGIFSEGVLVAASELSCVPQPQAGVGAALTLRCPVTVIGEVTVNGTQNIQLRWKVSAGTGTSINRMMNIRRIR